MKRRATGALDNLLSRLVLCCVAAPLIPGVAFAQSAAKPTVEIIVPFAPGGAVDRIARSVQRLLQDPRTGLSPIVVNRPGGAGNVGWAYLEKFEKSRNHIAIITPTIMTNHIMGRSRYNYSDFTPLATFYTESVAATVRAGSPIRDWHDLVARLKADPNSISFASSNREGAAPLTFALALKESGIDPKSMKLVVFNSAGEAVIAAAAGHVDVALSIAETVKPQLQDRRVRVLANSAPRRPPDGALATAPTLAELGVDVSFRSWRGMIGPRGLTASQLAFWDETLARMVATEDWAKELATYDAANEYLNSTAVAPFLKKQYEQLSVALAATGLMKR